MFNFLYAENLSYKFFVINLHGILIINKQTNNLLSKKNDTKNINLIINSRK